MSGDPPSAGAGVDGGAGRGPWRMTPGGAAAAVAALGCVALVAIPEPFRISFAVVVVLLAGVAGLEGLMPRSDRWRRWAYPLVAALVVLALYHPVLQAWWMGDDPAILAAIHRHGVLAHLTEPAVWRAFSASNFTPWVIVSFGLDWMAAGVHPALAYAHQLVSLMAVAVLGTVVVARFFRPITGVLAVSLFAVSVPVATAAQWLMTRHYVEGLGFALIAVGLFARAMRRDRLSTACLGALFYLLAVAAKEVYAPLLLLLAVVPGVGLRARIRHLLPFVGAAGAYVVWRAWMLGPTAILSGYGSVFQAQGSSGALRRLADVLGMGWWAPLLLVGGVLVADTIRRATQKDWRGLSVIALLVVAALAPLSPVMDMLQPRMAIVPSFMLAVWFAAAVCRGAESPVRITGAVALTLLAIAAMSRSSALTPTWRDRTEIARYRAEGMYVLDAGASLPLLDPVGPPWFYSALGELRDAGAAPPVCYASCLCRAAQQNATFVTFAGGVRRTVDVSSRECSFRAVAASVALSYDGTVVSWRLDPTTPGRWTVVDDTGWGQVIPARGRVPLHFAGLSGLRFLYRSPDGGESLTPRLEIDPAGATPARPATASWAGVTPAS